MGLITAVIRAVCPSIAPYNNYGIIRGSNNQKTRMKNIISSIFCAIMVSADPMGVRISDNSSHLESKVLNGKPAIREDTYVASLQLNSAHVCSAGLFKKDFLVTNGLCASHIGYGMEDEKIKGTAVLGDLNLEKGQRATILEVFYSSYRKVEYYDVGVIMIADSIDYTNIDIPTMYQRQPYFHHIGRNAALCGWGTTTDNGRISHGLGDAEYSHDLHCMSFNILPNKYCMSQIGSGDFARKLICGEAKLPEQIITWGDMGTPLVKNIMDDDNYNKYMIGISTSGERNEKNFFHRFIRMSYAIPFIKRVLDILHSKDEINAACSNNSSSSKEDLSDTSSKRSKHH